MSFLTFVLAVRYPRLALIYVVGVILSAFIAVLIQAVAVHKAAKQAAATRRREQIYREDERKWDRERALESAAEDERLMREDPEYRAIWNIRDGRARTLAWRRWDMRRDGYSEEDLKEHGL